MSMSEKEKDEILMEPKIIEPTITHGGKCLIIYVVTYSYYNRDAFKNTMKKVRQTVMQVTFKELGSKLLLVEFEDECYKNQVLSKGPWSFDKNMVLMKAMEKELQMTKIWIIEASLWVRLYDMPVHVMNERVGRLLGSAIGTLEEVDADQGDVAWGEYILPN